MVLRVSGFEVEGVWKSGAAGELEALAGCGSYVLGFWDPES